MRLLVALLIMIVAGAAVADGAARRIAEDRAARELERELQLDSEPDVRFGGWPFLTQVIGGEIGSARVAAGKISSDGVRLEDFEVFLEGLRLDLSDLFNGSSGRVHVAQGRGSATLGEKALNQTLRRKGIDARVRFNDGRTLVEVPGVGRVSGSVGIRDGAVVISAPSLQSNLTFELPRVIDGITYEDIGVLDHHAVLRFALDDAVIRRS